MIDDLIGQSTAIHASQVNSIQEAADRQREMAEQYRSLAYDYTATLEKLQGRKVEAGEESEEEKPETD